MTRWLMRVVPYRVVVLLARLCRLFTLYAPFTAGKGAVIEGRSFFALFDRHRIETEVGTLVGTRSNIRFPDMIQKSIFFCGVWEPSITAFIRHSLAPGDTFIDVGANIGFHTCLAARQVGPDGTVHAIEASPEICDILRGNLELNDAANVHVHNVAVMDTVCEVQVFMGPETALGVTTVTPDVAPDRRRKGGVAVSALPLYRVIDEPLLYSARLIKVDVEGAEWPVIRGISGRLHRFGDSTEWIFEFTPESIRRQGTDVDQILAIFARAGFRAFWLENPYDIDWYVQRTRAVLRAKLETLVRPLPENFDAVAQADVLLTRRAYD